MSNGKNMGNSNIFKATIILAAITFFSHEQCTKESKETKGDIKGVVKAINQNSSHEEGTYELICSALNFRDTIEYVKVVGGETVRHDFSLQPDSTMGRIVGEFQDLFIFKDSLQNNPGLADWDEKQIFDAATGATIQMKWLQDPVGDREVYLGDYLLGKSDAFGQYGFILQCGTYPVEGKCEGYISKTHIVKVLPDTKIYLNFILERD